MEEGLKVKFRAFISLGILLNILFLLGQTMAIIDYDLAVELGFQEPVSDVTEVGVALNKGFGLADTIVYVPLFVLGIIGLIKKHRMGFYAMFAAMGITVYWPVVSLSTVFYAKGAKGWFFNDYTAYTVILLLVVCYGIWGMSLLIKNKPLLVKPKIRKEVSMV